MLGTYFVSKLILFRCCCRRCCTLSLSALRRLTYRAAPWGSVCVAGLLGWGVTPRRPAAPRPGHPWPVRAVEWAAAAAGLTSNSACLMASGQRAECGASVAAAVRSGRGGRRRPPASHAYCHGEAARPAFKSLAPPRPPPCRSSQREACHVVIGSRGLREFLL